MRPSEQLVEFQAENRRRTVEKIDAAMATIDIEVAERGYYPENGGRITLRELCRRAGLGESTLKNRTHTETTAKVHRWLERLKKKAPTLKAEVEDAKQVRIAGLLVQIERIAHHYNRFKIEYEILQKRNGELEEELAALRKKLAEQKVGIVRLVD